MSRASVYAVVWGAMLAMLCIVLPPRVAGAQPVRPVRPVQVVSMNMCTDQLLLQFADRRQIASVSHYATDPARSLMATEAVGIAVNHGLVEEIIPLAPDLVLTGAFSNRAAVAMLKRLQIPVLELPVAANFADIRHNVRKVATAIGHPQRGDTAIVEMDRQLAQSEFHGPNPEAAFFEPNSFTLGRGTLAHEALIAAGFTNLAQRLGLPGNSRLPLETLLEAQPEVLVMDPPKGLGAVATEPLRHPALKKVFGPEQFIRVPSRLWVCGTPMITQAVARLADKRRALNASTAQAGL